jgi:dipeptidase E
MADAESWFATIDVPAYVMDDQTAIVWMDGEVEVVSEGEWHFLNR